MERAIIPVFYVFVGHGIQQHAGAGWEGSPRLRYDAYFISSHISLKDAIYFSYAASFSIQNYANYLSEEDDDDFIAPSDISL